MALPEHVQQQRKELVDQLVKDIEAGKPFFWDSGHFGKRPRNLLLSTKGKDRFYRGINSMELNAVANMKGFKDSRWGTYDQARLAGGNVKKGEKGTHIEYWQYTKDVMKKNPATGKMEPVYVIDPDTGERTRKQERLEHPIVKTYVVFNASQMEGIPEEHPIMIDEKDKNEYMENMLANSEAKIFYDQTNRNFYRSSADEIHVMDRKDFKSLDAFYSTVAHEIAHSTGAESRLNRETLKNNDGFGGPIYAQEELRAEMASMFLQQEYGIKFDESHYKNHAAYLQAWAKALKKDPNELFRAAADAEKAAEYIKEHMLEKGLEKIRDKEPALGVEAKPEMVTKLQQEKEAKKARWAKSKARSYPHKEKQLSPKEKLHQELTRKQSMSKGRSI